MNLNESTDVIVIGGGPAGSATALFLSAKGYRVLLLEQALFPRDKVCGEFISPAADDLLAELGVLESIAARSSQRLLGVSISAYGDDELHIDYPALSGQKMTSLSLPRTTLDALLLGAAEQQGVKVLQGHKVTDLIMQEEQVIGVEGRDDQKKPFTYQAKVVVDAGGRNCISLRRLGLRQENRVQGKIALAAHWSGVEFREPYCFMHISRPGYTGMAPVGPGQVNVILVVDQHLITGKNADDFYRHSVLKNPLRRKLLSNATMTEKVRLVESLAYSVKPPSCGGLLLVGCDFDCSQFFLAEQVFERLDPRFDIGDRFGDPADPLTGYILKRTGLEHDVGIVCNSVQQGKFIGVVNMFAQLGDGFAVAFHRRHYGVGRRFGGFDHGDHLIGHALEIVALIGWPVDRRDFLADTHNISRKTVKLLYQPVHCILRRANTPLHASPAFVELTRED